MNKLRMYQIAGIGIHVHHDDQWVLSSAGVLENYQVNSIEKDEEFVCHVVNKLPIKQGEKVYYDSRKHVIKCADGYVRYEGDCDSIESCYACLCRCSDLTHVYLKQQGLVDGIPSHVMAELFELEHLLAKRKGILLHAAVICVDDEAIVFTAPSQIGKSTQAKLWEVHEGAKVINGDRCAICVEPEGVFVYGVPFSGSSKIRENVRLPLKAIVYLSQEIENSAQLCTGASAFRRVYEGCSVQLWNQQDVECVSETVVHIVRHVPVIHLGCRPDLAAVQCLKKILKENV